MLHKTLLATLEQVDSVFSCFETLAPEERDSLFVSSRVGPHLRHIYDHILALMKGSKEGVVDYNRRNRNSAEERSIGCSKMRLQQIKRELSCHSPDLAPVVVISEIDCAQSIVQRFDSSVDREFLYLINHTLHHLAYVGLVLSHAGLALPPHVGVAPGTASFLRQEQVAQELSDVLAPSPSA